MATWYVVDSRSSDRVVAGPFTRDELADLVVDGRLTPTTLVAAVGAGEWVAAADEPGLAPLFGGPASRGTFSIDSGSTASRRGTSAAHAGGGPRHQSTNPEDIQPPLPAYSFSAAFEQAIGVVKARWGLLAAAGLVLSVVSVATAIPGSILEAMGQASGDPTMEAATAMLGLLVNTTLFILVDVPLWAGVVVCSANAIAGRGGIGDVLLGFGRYLPVMGAILLANLVTLGVAVASGLGGLAIGTVTSIGAGISSGDPSPLAGVVVGFASGLMLLVAGTASVSMRVILAPQIAADPHAGGAGSLEALRRSWKSTRGLGWSMLALGSVVGVAAVLSILLLCVGWFIIGMPLLLATHGAMYAMIVRTSRAPMDERRARFRERITVWIVAGAILVMMAIAVAAAAVHGIVDGSSAGVG